MPYNIPRFPLDTSGTNPNNFIIDEPHTLSNKPVRAVSPNYGPFFTYNLVVKDGSNTLVRGQDYQITELHQEATLRFGKEIASVILIINPNVSSNITISYQVLGGHYAYDDTTIANVYQAVINDNRPVSWTNIINKPSEFNPTIHRHLLEDIYGFEPVVDVLERIKRAITLGQTEVLMAVLNNLAAGFINYLFLDRLIGLGDVLHILTTKKLLSKVSCKVLDITTTAIKGRTIKVKIDTVDYPVGTNIYYKFLTGNNESSNFLKYNGVITTDNNVKYLYFYIHTQDNIDLDKKFYFVVKDSLNQEDYIAVSNKFLLEEAITTTDFISYYINSLDDQNDLTFYDLADYSSEEYLQELRLLST